VKTKVQLEDADLMKLPYTNCPFPHVGGLPLKEAGMQCQWTAQFLRRQQGAKMTKGPQGLWGLRGLPDEVGLSSHFLNMSSSQLLEKYEKHFDYI